ncbi:hypothetical protein LCGC14_1357860 [marine sediment metagenome]|uniref:Right handed beta helix domain-containing protein n=1 Tax=marine sediment metagenome TaxID=412755 RepID=A0A0F9KV35_9ZZZZ
MANLTVEEDGGGDYTTLDEACDNITATDTITIQGAWDNPDTRSVIISVDCVITATGDARISTSKHFSGTPTHYRLEVADGNHCITVNDTPTTIDGIEVKQNANGSSDEGIRMAHATGTLNVKNCILWSTYSGADQDAIYAGAIDCTINVENVITYSWLRCGLHPQISTGTHTQTWNAVCWSAWKCGTTAETEGGGIVLLLASIRTYNINIHNSWVLDCSIGAEDYGEFGTGGTVTWGISYSIDSDNSIASRDAGGAGNLASRTIRDSTGGGNEVIVNDITGVVGTDKMDLALTDDEINNDAQDAHTTDTAESQTIPSTDIDGTSRPQNTNHDMGAFEIVAAAAEGANPNQTQSIIMGWMKTFALGHPILAAGITGLVGIIKRRMRLMK